MFVASHQPPLFLSISSKTASAYAQASLNLTSFLCTCAYNWTSAGSWPSACGSHSPLVCAYTHSRLPVDGLDWSESCGLFRYSCQKRVGVRNFQECYRFLSCPKGLRHQTVHFLQQRVLLGAPNIFIHGLQLLISQWLWLSLSLWALIILSPRWF